MPTALIIGASRGIGLGLVEEFAKRGWAVTGTVRSEASAGDLKMMAKESGGKIAIEQVDTTDAASGVKNISYKLASSGSWTTATPKPAPGRWLHSVSNPMKGTRRLPSIAVWYVPRHGPAVPR